MEKKKLITALMICCMAVLPAKSENFIDQEITGEGQVNISGGVATNPSGSTMTITNSEFTGNTGNCGGVIYNSGNLVITGGTADIDGNVTGNTVFSGNSAHAGGAIYSYTDGATVTIGDYTSFENNKGFNEAGDAGGAIYVGNADLLQIGNHVNFSGNAADSPQNPDTGAVGLAGAAYITNTKTTIGTHLNVSDNEANRSGGGLYIWNYDRSSAEIGEYATFKDNKSITSGGGAIANYDGELTIKAGANFEGNTAATNGGAILNNSYLQNAGEPGYENFDAIVNIEGGTFANNSAANGGAIYNEANSTINVSNVIFTDNKAEKGGAIYNAENGNTTLTNVIVNEAGKYGSNSIYNAGTIKTAVDNGVNTFNSDIISENGTLNLGGTNNIGGDISGTGTVANNGTSVFAGDNSGFTGTFTQDSSTAETTVTGTFFGGTSTIEDGILNWETDNKISKGSLDITDGELNIGNTNTGNLTVDANVTIDNAVATTINDGSTLTVVNGGSITMGSDDTWDENGSISLTAGDLTLSGITTTGILEATGGTLTMNGVQLSENFSIATDVVVKSDTGFEIVENTHFTYDDNDEIGGPIKLVGGTLDYDADENNSIELSATSGNLNLLEDSYLKVTNQSSINDNVIVDIRNGSTLEVLNGEFNLNGITGSPEQSDQWNGMIINNGGILNAENISNSATGALEQEKGITNITNNSSVNLGATSSVTGGTINVTGNSILNAVNSEIIKGGEINVTSGSTFSTGGGSGFDGLATQGNELLLATSGLVDSRNGAMETHQGDILSIGSADRSEADFTLDVLGRSNERNGSDKFVFNTIDATGNDATLNISDWSLGGDIYGWDAPIDRHIELGNLFESANLNENVDLNVTDKEVHTPIGYYKLNNTGGLGGAYSLDLARFDGPVFRGQVATVAQWMNQLAIDDMLFTHSMVLPSFKEEDGGTASSGVMANRYAATSPMFAPYQYSRKDGGLWYKMYGNFESLQMNNGLRVGNNSYGALIGADFGLKELKHGWKFMPTAYIGYNGAHQTFANMGAYQNGGQAGFLGTFYKNNFIIGGLVYGGVYDNSMDVAGHTENTFNYFAGAATKAAYNIRLHRDWVLQPNIMAAYNFFGQQNWHSDYGQMGMMAGMLHGVNIAPGVNLIWEKDTFSAYITLQYMYNVNGAVGGRAGNVDLPQMEMERGYIQYGIGFTKKFTDRASGYLQAVLRNVGRTGAGFQLGFNYFIGK